MVSQSQGGSGSGSGSGSTYFNLSLPHPTLTPPSPSPHRDTSDFFDGPASEATVTLPAPLTYRIGGREVMTGEEQTVLVPGMTYHVRITAFNSVGYGVATSTVLPFALTADTVPLVPPSAAAASLSPTSIAAKWGTPLRDGGEVLDYYRVEWDVDDTFANVNGSAASLGGYVDAPVVKEVQSLAVNSTTQVSEEQWVLATVEVTNERQTIRTNVTGVDEVQIITSMADEVLPEIQTVTTTAVDYNEEQVIRITGEDGDEVQTIRTETAARYEVQVLTVSAARVPGGEVQKVTIKLTGDTSTAAKEAALQVGWLAL